MKAIELRIKETLSGSISHKRMVSHCACNDISVLVFLVSMFLSLPSQNSSNELEKQGICRVEGNDVCPHCYCIHTSHPPLLLYTPLILLHCYTYLSSSFIATHLSSSFIAIHTSHPLSLLHTSHPPSLLYIPLILLHCYTYLSSSFIAIHTLLHCYTFI